MKILALFAPLLLLLAPQKSQALTINDQIAALSVEYKKLGGNEKALAQLQCFIRNHGKEVFIPKPLSLKNADSGIIQRCNSQKTLRWENTNTIALLDYTKASNKRRFFLFDLRAGKVRAIYVSHGRFNETPRWNSEVIQENKKHRGGNSVREAVYFSNEPGKNATAGGFYLTAGDYNGQHGRSLIMHGLERGVNDNSCRRSTVIHKSSFVTDSGVERMSSGCPMVAVNRLNPVIDSLQGGALLYFYTPAEAALSTESCGRNLWAR